MKFDHIGISVTDIDRSIAFYRDFFGMEQLCEVFPFGGEQSEASKFEAIMDIPGVTGRMCMIGKGDLKLELFAFTNSRAKDPEYAVSDRGYSHFGIEVEDIAATYQKLRDANVRIHSPVITFSGGAVNAAYCRDPDGNVFELVELRRPG